MYTFCISLGCEHSQNSSKCIKPQAGVATQRPECSQTWEGFNISSPTESNRVFLKTAIISLEFQCKNCNPGLMFHLPGALQSNSSNLSVLSALLLYLIFTLLYSVIFCCNTYQKTSPRASIKLARADAFALRTTPGCSNGMCPELTSTALVVLNASASCQLGTLCFALIQTSVLRFCEGPGASSFPSEKRFGL